MSVLSKTPWLKRLAIVLVTALSIGVLAVPTAPANAQACYCINNCGPTPMSKAECSANQAQFDKICAKVALPCPANLIQCLPPPQPLYTSHMCVAN